MSDEAIAINPFLEKIFKKYDQYWLQKKTYASLTPLGFGYQLNDKAKRKLYGATCRLPKTTHNLS